MGKQWYAVLLTACMLFVLTGCATIGMDFTFSGDGSGRIQITQKIDKAAYLDYLRETYGNLSIDTDAEDILNNYLEQGTYTEETIDGTDYLVMESSEGNTEFDSIPAFYAQMGFNCNYEVTETSFCVRENGLSQQNLDLNDYFDTEGMTQEELQKYLGNSYLELSVTFDYPVKDTNGSIDPDNPDRVSWKYTLAADVDMIFAYCDSSISFSGVTQGTVSKEPVTFHFDGAETAELNGKSIENDKVFSVDGTYCIILKNKTEQKTVYFAIDRTAPQILNETGTEVSFTGYQKKSKVLYLSDDGGILSAEIDGKSVLECNLQGDEEFIYYVTITPSSLTDGKHTLTVTDTYGNEQTITFKTDKTAPVVKGVKHKKTYKKAVKIKFSDAASGIKSALLNGKKITSGTKLKTVGSYTLKVKDKAGNLTTVKFKIKEKKKKK
jgi:hypothetical protein